MAIQFYATFAADDVRPYIPEGIAVLLPASSFARFCSKKTGALKPGNLPPQVTRRAADSGGYVATKKFGDYQYSQEQYTDWLFTFNPQWAAMRDYCCEPDIATDSNLMVIRQARTTENAYATWGEYKDTPFAWVPTVQGWEPADYVRHAAELKPLITEMASHYGKDSEFRVGIGSLCQREKTTLIQDVVRAVQEVLPDYPLHLWGVKGAVLREKSPLLARVVSVDSAAWTWAANTNRRGTGLSKREYAINIQLPEYVRKFYAGITK